MVSKTRGVKIADTSRRLDAAREKIFQEAHARTEMAVLPLKYSIFQFVSVTTMLRCCSFRGHKSFLSFVKWYCVASGFVLIAVVKN